MNLLKNVKLAKSLKTVNGGMKYPREEESLYTVGEYKKLKSLENGKD
jgi:hypothetical protein